MKKGINHLFFDLDDTLWDFETNSDLVLRQIYSEFGLEKKLGVVYSDFISQYKVTKAELWQKYSKRSITKEELRNLRFETVFQKFGYSNYNENLDVTHQYLTRAPHGKALKEGCLEVLDFLSKKYQLHIITNGFKEIQHIKLNGSELKPYFKNIIISEEHGLSKPHPEIFRLAEKMALAESHECLMIGDNHETDVMGAIQSGWKAIHYHPVKHPDVQYQISHLLQLKELL